MSLNAERANRVVLITGCSSGIGRQTAILLANRGVQVLAGVRREADGSSLRRESDRIAPVLLDVTDPDSIQRIADAIHRDYPAGIDGLINNAGIAIAGPLELVELNLWRLQYEVNVLGIVRLTQAMLPSLRRRGGRIINVGSASSALALPMMGPYSSSKAAVHLLSDALRRELQPSGVRVVVVSPGQTETAIYAKSERDAEQRLEAAEQPEGYDYLPTMRRFQEVMQQSASLRGSPERVAAKVVHAFFAKRPRPYYHVGWDARMSVLVSHFVPVRLVDWIIRRRLRPKGSDERFKRSDLPDHSEAVN